MLIKEYQHLCSKRFWWKRYFLSFKILTALGIPIRLDFKGALSGLRQFLTIESPLKLIKNAFYFILKAIFVLKIFKFLSGLFGYVEKARRRRKLISKFMTSQPGYQAITVHILPNILRSRGNQTIKFVQLIEYNMRNIFPEKSYTKYG